MSKVEPSDKLVDQVRDMIDDRVSTDSVRDALIWVLNLPEVRILIAGKVEK